MKMKSSVTTLHQSAACGSESETRRQTVGQTISVTYTLILCTLGKQYVCYH